MASVDEAVLKKALWTAYWRGTATAREQIEGLIDAQAESAHRAIATARPGGRSVLVEVQDFASLARAGSPSSTWSPTPSTR